METYFNYIIESGISLGVFTLIYWLLLRKEVLLNANRIYFLAALLFSTFLPFLKINVDLYNMVDIIRGKGISQLFGLTFLETITVYASGFPSKVGQALISIKPSIWFYCIGASLAFFFLLAGIAQLFSVITHNRSFRLRFARLIVTRKAISPYSFFNFIFINRELPKQENWKAMVHHELEHVKQGHSIDVLFVDFMMVFQWFNPFYWIIRRMVRENHEFLADRAVLLHRGITAGNYKALLLSQAIGGHLVMTSNFFNVKSIQKRFKMITKNRSGKYSFLKYSFGLFVAVAITLLFACEKKLNDNKAEKVVIIPGSEKSEGIKGVQTIPADGEVAYIEVENRATFQGGDLNSFRNWVERNLKYPEVAAKNGISGKVYVQFAVNSKGDVVDVVVLRGVDPSLDNESIRAIKSSPKWEPAMQGGKNVKQQFVIPLSFVLQ